MKTMDERRAAALAPEQFQLAVIGSFAGIAILLAAAGVYGVVSYLVARRNRNPDRKPKDTTRRGGRGGLVRQ